MKKKLGVYNTLIIIETRNKQGDILYKVKKNNKNNEKNNKISN